MPPAQEDTDDAHGAAATRTGRTEGGRLVFVRCRGGGPGRRRRTEQHADAIELLLAVGPCEEAVVSDAMEAAGQDVEEKAADELARLQRQGAVAGGTVLAIVLDAECDGAAVKGGDAA